jgi:allophanate hydrolase
MNDLSLDIAGLGRRYRRGALTPVQLVEELDRRLSGADAHRVWITRLSRDQLLAYARALEARDPASLPLYGIPFAIKDNVDLAGVPTTAACPEYAYAPQRSATVVQRLIDAGAIPVGKTNLDQFATGLNGTRSPYGASRNSFDPQYIAGGSSSGSALAVALGQVSFALGTDTAGSGRVPAAFNNLVGVKPTRGLVSTSGVVPACRTLDCVSVFALTTADAEAVLQVAAGFDIDDPYSRRAPAGRASIPDRFRFGVPRQAQLEFFGDAEQAALFAAAVEQLQELGGEHVEIDFTPFRDAARLLYEGPWLAERYAAIRELIERRPQALHPVTRAIIEQGREPSAVEGFAAMYRLAELRRAVEPVLAAVDVIVTPTAPRMYRLAELEADPFTPNTELGYYTNFMNLLDLAALAIPAGFSAAGLPFGLTLFADAWSDQALLALGARFEQAHPGTLGATRRVHSPAPRPASLPAGHVAVAVCGAHLAGLALNRQLTDRGGVLLEATHTASCYRFYALPGGPPYRPGLVRVRDGGARIAVELWALPIEHFGSFVAGIPAPLGIGTVELADGRRVQGFVCEGYAVEGAEDITAHGGWRRYLEARDRTTRCPAAGQQVE